MWWTRRMRRRMRKTRTRADISDEIRETITDDDVIPGMKQNVCNQIYADFQWPP